MKLHPITIEHRRHHQRVRELGCIITGRPKPTLHHTHGGSMSELGYHSGGALRGVTTGPDGPVDPHYLVIPLDAELHSGSFKGIDGGLGVYSWEKAYKTQVELLDIVSRRLGVNVWHLAGAHRHIEGLD